MKHLLLLPAMLLVTAVSVAQLYVAPSQNGTPGDPSDDTDSYIYVNDEILFVEDDINLTLNNVDRDYKASIYLRNGAQLFQGESNGANSGSGYLSTYRLVVDSDAWDYTFYGSPVGDIRTNPLAAAGNLNHGSRSIFSVVNSTYSKSRFITSNHNGYHNGTDLYISDRWIHTRAPGAASDWVRMYGNPVAPPGQGFIMKGVNAGDPNTAGNNDYTYDFRGRPNNGTFNFNTVPVVGLGTEEVLTGNPYPSALDLNRLFYDTTTGDADGTNTNQNSEIDAILFWDEDRTIDSHLYIDNKGGFGVWMPGLSNPDGTNPGSYVVAPFLSYESNGDPIPGSNPGIGGLSYPRRFAPIGQGFYLQTINSSLTPLDITPNQVAIKNKYRRVVREGASSVFRSANPTDADVVGNVPADFTLPQIRLFTYFDQSHFRDMLLLFSNRSTDFYDRGMDARHPMDATFSDAYFPVDINGDGQNIGKFIMQTIPFSEEKRVPYAIKLEQQTEVTLQIVENIKFNYAVYLYDQELNTYKKISGDSAASITLPAGDYIDRFYLVFKGLPGDGTLTGAGSFTDARAAEIAEVTGNVDFFQNNIEAQLEIMNPEAYDIKFAHIFDMTGKLVATRTDMGTNTNYSISTATMADGVYLVKLVTATNVAINYKAIVTNK